MHCPCLIFSAVCNDENLNLFIPQTLDESLAPVGGYCGGGEGTHVTVTSLPEGRQNHIIFLHERMNLLT